MTTAPVAPVQPIPLLLLVQLLAARLDAVRAEAAGYGYWSGYEDAAADRAYWNPWRAGPAELAPPGGDLS